MMCSQAGVYCPLRVNSADAVHCDLRPWSREGTLSRGRESHTRPPSSRSYNDDTQRESSPTPQNRPRKASPKPPCARRRSDEEARLLGAVDGPTSKSSCSSPRSIRQQAPSTAPVWDGKTRSILCRRCQPRRPRRRDHPLLALVRRRRKSSSSAPRTRSPETLDELASAGSKPPHRPKLGSGPPSPFSASHRWAPRFDVAALRPQLHRRPSTPNRTSETPTRPACSPARRRKLSAFALTDQAWLHSPP